MFSESCGCKRSETISHFDGQSINNQHYLEDEVVNFKSMFLWSEYKIITYFGINYAYNISRLLSRLFLKTQHEYV